MFPVGANWPRDLGRYRCLDLTSRKNLKFHQPIGGARPIARLGQEPEGYRNLGLPPRYRATGCTKRAAWPNRVFHVGGKTYGAHESEPNREVIMIEP
jgi:hypothetical protein